MLTPVIRHGFTFWEAPRCPNPPLPELDPPDEDKPLRIVNLLDTSPEAVARRERNRTYREILKERANQPVQIPIEIPSTLKAIQEAVMAYFGVQPTEFFSNSKANRVALPRIASMALCRELTNHSLKEIGRVHGKDHGTVLHACERFEDLREVDAEYRTRAEKAETAIRGA
jgi:chromosomal replication initiation ATPase DnaA